jgi:outer membrane receptor protein involved in Fe transport
MMNANAIWLDGGPVGSGSYRMRPQIPCLLLLLVLLQEAALGDVPGSTDCNVSATGEQCPQAPNSAQARALTPQANELEGIVITADKRPEDIKEVPVSVTVLSGAALESQKIENYDDLARVVPGLAVNDAGAPNLTRLTLRGISSATGTATVGIYLDDISLTIPNLFFTGTTLPQLFDLQDAEILRGPQGTLYGASSLGGTIRFTSVAPRMNTFEGSVRTDLADTNAAGFDYLVQGVMNAPLIEDKMALRIGVQSSDDAGYVNRIGAAGAVYKGVNDDRTTSGRATLLIEPTQDLTIKPALLWQMFSTDGTDAFDLALPPHEQQKLTGEPDTDRLLVPSLTIDAGLHEVSLISVTSYVSRTNDRIQDGQAYNSEYLASVLDPDYGSTFDAIGALPGPYSNKVSSRQWSEELRLRSNSTIQAGRPYEWQIGVYYFDQNIRTLDDEYVTGLATTLEDLFPGQDPSTVLGAPLVNDELGYFHYHNLQREEAIFGEGSYELLTGLKATFGFRQSFAHTEYNLLEGGWLALGLPAAYSKGDTEQPFTPKVALTYDLNQDATVYATAAKGFRLGGAGAPLPSSCAASLSSYGLSGADNSYGPDSLWSYEGGAKLRLFGDRLSVNADGFYIDWSNIQQSLYLPSCGYEATVNAGDARSYGGELETTLHVTRNLSLGFNGSVDDAKITQAAPGTGASDGDWLLGVPKYNFSVDVDDRYPITPALRGYFHTDIDRVGDSYGSFDITDPDYSRSAYTTVNMNLGVEAERYDLSIFARNLLNNDTIIQRPALLFINQGVTIRPRTVGLSLRAKF